MSRSRIAVVAAAIMAPFFLFALPASAQAPATAAPAEVKELIKQDITVPAEGRVVEKGKAGPLRDEFSMLLKQLKMGKTREEALKAMIVRVDLPALTSFVTALIQADKMGTSLGKVLRIQSTQLRIDRTQRAEKLAGEAPVKMLFPLIACIFPTVFMVLFGPIVFALMFGEVGS